MFVVVRHILLSYANSIACYAKNLTTAIISFIVHAPVGHT